MYQLKKYLQSYIYPLTLSIFLPFFVLWVSYFIFEVMIYIGKIFEFTWMSNTKSFWTSVLPVALSGVSATAISYLVGNKVLEPTNINSKSVKQLFNKTAASIQLNYFFLFIALLSLKIISFKSNIFATYLLTYLASSWFITFAYFGAQLHFKKKPTKKLAVLFFVSTLTLLFSLDFYIPNSTNFYDWRVVAIHLIYLFVTTMAIYYLDQLLRFNKETRLQNSLVILWLMTLLIIAAYVSSLANFSEAKNYLTVIFIVFAPIILGLFLNIILVLTQDEIEQKAYKPLSLLRTSQLLTNFSIPRRILDLLIITPFEVLTCLLIHLPIMLLEIIFMPDTALKPQMLFRLTKRKSLELKKTSLLDSRLV
ncbi:hypothetical protein EI16_04985, partial [Hydrogenovibrio marinus]